MQSQISQGSVCERVCQQRREREREGDVTHTHTHVRAHTHTADREREALTQEGFCPQQFWAVEEFQCS